VIKAYGLFWNVDKVFWGRPNNPGSLRGARSRSARARPVEFRNQRGVYALYADYDLVYVGQTGAGENRLFKRLKHHTDDHLAERWNRFSWFGTQWVTQQHQMSMDTAALTARTEVALNILEAITIAVAEPRLNLQRGRWGEATLYYQVEPEPDE